MKETRKCPRKNTETFAGFLALQGSKRFFSFIAGPSVPCQKAAIQCSVYEQSRKTEEENPKR
jgi:hypothetical protein